MGNTVMINKILATTSNVDYGKAFSSERVSLAVEVTLIGMLLIFAVLAFLWIILTIFQKVMARDTVKPTINPKQVPAPATAMPVPVAVEPVPVSAVSNDDEIIAAVIAAAVAAYMADEGNTETAYNGGFRVVSFRRVQGGKAWNSKH